MATRQFRRDIAACTAGVVIASLKVVTSTSGTISTSSGDTSYLTIAKTAAEAGRYTVTLVDYYNQFLGCSVIVEGAADAAYADTKGLIPFVRNVAITSTSKTFDIQFAYGADNTDAELDDAASFYVTVMLKNSTVV